MPSIPIQQIEDNMILAEPLIGTTGNVILPKGASLKKALINRLSSWGIQSLEIEGEENTSQIDPTELKETLYSLHLGNSPHQLQMLKTIIKYRTSNS